MLPECLTIATNFLVSIAICNSGGSIESTEADDTVSAISPVSKHVRNSRIDRYSRR
jgi:hypothetical protein